MESSDNWDQLFRELGPPCFSLKWSYLPDKGVPITRMVKFCLTIRTTFFCKMFLFIFFFFKIYKKWIWYQFKIFSKKYAHNKKKMTARSWNCSVSAKFFPMLVKTLCFGGIINQKTYWNHELGSKLFSWVVWHINKWTY